MEGDHFNMTLQWFFVMVNLSLFSGGSYVEGDLSDFTLQWFSVVMNLSLFFFFWRKVTWRGTPLMLHNCGSLFVMMHLREFYHFPKL